MKAIAVFDYGGVDRASVVYHLAWMYSELDFRVVVADLNPQRPTGSPRPGGTRTAAAALDSMPPSPFGGPFVSPRKHVRRTSCSWTSAVSTLSAGRHSWPPTRSSSMWSSVPIRCRESARPVPALRLWRQDWQARRDRASSAMELPKGPMKPVGYVPLPPATQIHRPVDAYGEWLDRIPAEYGRYAEGNPTLDGRSLPMGSDGRCLGRLRHFVTLRSLAEDVRKPIFGMKPADGLLGSYADVVRGCYDDFRALALEIARRCDVQLAD